MVKFETRDSYQENVILKDLPPSMSRLLSENDELYLNCLAWQGEVLPSQGEEQKGKEQKSHTLFRSITFGVLTAADCHIRL